MVFILGSNVIESVLLKDALRSFYGIGPQVCARLMAKLTLHQRCTVGALATAQVNRLNDELADMTLENDLKRKMRDNIRRLRDIGSYRGRRHAQGYPVRGQRTRSQIMTARRLNKTERYA